MTRRLIYVFHDMTFRSCDLPVIRVLDKTYYYWNCGAIETSLFLHCATVLTVP